MSKDYVSADEETYEDAPEIVRSWYTEARILIGVDPEPESESGQRLKFLFAILQEYEKAVMELKELDK